MIQAMYSGIAGMKAFKSSLDVIGNNIANVNTTAYKAGRATFKEMLSQTLSGATGPGENRGGVNPSQIGLGVSMGSVDINSSQGSMTSTGRTTDLAIEGSGYFALGGGGTSRYTRDGSFSLDSEFNLVSGSTGYNVLGWSADPNTGEVDTTQPITDSSSIKIPIGGLSVARQTSVIDVSGNLNASAEVGETSGTREIKFDVYDSLGLSHDMTMVFTKLAAAAGPPVINASTWKYEVFCPDTGAAAVTSGNIEFDALGYSKLDQIDLSLTITPSNGCTSPLETKLNLGDISQLNGDSTADLAYQNGLPLGTLESFNIDRTGLIVGTFTNGSTRNLGQLAIAQFNNPAGLSKVGNNMFSESPNSGTPKLGVPGQAGLGMVTSGFLEASNVDLANEFASMIVAQRGFQANSRIITTSDEVLQELVSLKR